MSSDDDDDSIRLDDVQTIKMNNNPIDKTLARFLLLFFFGVVYGIIIGVGGSMAVSILSNPHPLYRNDEFHAFNVMVIHKSGLYDCIDALNCVLIQSLNQGRPCVCENTLEINMYRQHTTYWHLGPLNGSLVTLNSLLLL